MGFSFTQTKHSFYIGDACRTGPCSQTSNLEVPQGPLGELQRCSWGCPAANQMLVNPGTLESLGLSVPSLLAPALQPQMDWVLSYFLLPPCFRNYALLSSCCQICIHTPTPQSDRLPPDAFLCYSEPFAASMLARLEILVWPFPKLETRQCHPYLGTLRLHIPAPSQAQPLWRYLPDTRPASLPPIPCISSLGDLVFLPSPPCLSIPAEVLAPLTFPELCQAGEGPTLGLCKS